MKKILLVALMALCGVSFGFGSKLNCRNQCKATAEIEAGKCSNDSECINKVLIERTDCMNQCNTNPNNKR